MGPAGLRCKVGVLSTISTSILGNGNQIQLKAKAILTYMRLVSRPRRIRQIAREGIIKWAKIRAAERKEQRRIEDLRGLRGEAPSASTRHGSTTFEQPPTKSTKSKEPKRRNRGQTQTRSKIGWRVAEAIERMGAISRRIVRREKKGDG